MKKLFILFLLLTILFFLEYAFANNNELILKDIIIKLSQNIVTAVEYLSSTANGNEYKSTYGSNIKVSSSDSEADGLNDGTASLKTGVGRENTGSLKSGAESSFEQTAEIQGSADNGHSSDKDSMIELPSAASSIAEFSAQTGPVVFFGDSITKGMEQFNYFPEIFIKAEIGLSTTGALSYADSIALMKPSKLFILLGINDFWEGGNSQTFLDNYRTILSTIQSISPDTEIYIQSIFPLGKTAIDRNKNINNSIIDNINVALQGIAAEMNATYIDVNNILKGSDGNLPNQYTSDGIHINVECYRIWADFLSKYIDTY